MVRHLFTLFLCLIFTQVHSQDVRWTGKVMNDKSNEVLVGASIQQIDGKHGILSKNEGVFEFTFDSSEGLTFQISYIGYKTKILTLNKEDFTRAILDGKDIFMIQQNIYLSRDLYDIDQVVITASPNPPDTVYGEEEYNVGDFAFIEEDYMLLLTYEKEKRWKREGEVNKSLYTGCRLVLLNSKNERIDEISLGEKICEEFYEDFPGTLFLKTKYDYYLIYIENNDIGLQSYSTEEFESLIEPVVDTIGDFVYITSYSPDYPAFEYYVYDRRDSSYHVLHSVVDQPTMDLFRSEYKYMDPRDKLEAYRYELATGVDKEIVAAYMTGFTSDIYYNSLYAPIFVNNDTVLVFDHYSDKMYTFDKNNHAVDSVLISYHKTKGAKKWQKKVLQDASDSEVYTVYKKNNYLYLNRIDKSTGDSNFAHKLFYKFSEHLRVRNGYLYYIYRPFESSQKKFLYKEELGY